MLVKSRGTRLKLLTWAEFAAVEPEMAEFGLKRLEYRVMYLATVRKNGCPRVHHSRRLSDQATSLLSWSPHPLKHWTCNATDSTQCTLVTDMDGSNGEFTISGRAQLVTTPATRELAVKGCPYIPKERYICFEFKLEECMTNIYADGFPNTKHWKEKPRT